LIKISAWFKKPFRCNLPCQPQFINKIPVVARQNFTGLFSLNISIVLTEIFFE